METSSSFQDVNFASQGKYFNMASGTHEGANAPVYSLDKHMVFIFERN